MSQTAFGRFVLIILLCLAMSVPARAQSLGSAALEIGVGIVVAGVVVAVGAALLITHYAKKRTITGCALSSDGGLSITDEGDKKTYQLSGSMAGVTPGDRIRLHGKKLKPANSDKKLVWETTKVAQDFGVCQQ